MIFQGQQAFRALILLAFTLLIFKLHYTGEITKYVNPKYISLSQIASVLFLVLFFIQITRLWGRPNGGHHACGEGHHATHVCGCEGPDDDDHHGHDDHHHHDHGDQPLTFRKMLSYSIIVFPLVTGFFLPAQTLNASMAENKGGMDVLVKKSEDSSSDSLSDSPTVPNSAISDSQVLPNPNEEVSQAELDALIHTLKNSPKIEMTEELYHLYYEEISKDVASFKGRPIKFTGFVYKEEGFAANQLVVSRYLITHCVADASIVGFLTELDNAPEIAEDTWLEASGVIETTLYNGTEIPFIKITNWKVINSPDQPYVYPLILRIM